MSTRRLLATCDTPADLGALIYLRNIEVGNYWQAMVIRRITGKPFVADHVSELPEALGVVA